METNLEKAKRQIKDNAAIMGVDLPEDGFIFQMLELAATPNLSIPEQEEDYPEFG